MRRKRIGGGTVGGFTLIELLIVVAIIAILAAIAVPNFLEAQVRAKISREMNDMRAVATGLESYAVDHNVYPPHGEIRADGTINYPAFQAGIGTVEFIAPAITTPIAYLTRILEDPMLNAEQSLERRSYGYIRSALMAEILIGRGIRTYDDFTPTYGGWRMYAAGPDGDKGIDTKQAIPYDPTNGTVSNGDIMRSQKNPSEKRNQDE